MTRRATTTVLSLLVFAVSACGGSSSEDPTAAVEAAFNALGRDLAAGDGDAVCRGMGERAQTQLRSATAFDGPTSCEEAVEVAASMMPEDDKAAMDDFRFRRVRLEGNRAEVLDEDVVVPPNLDRDRNEDPMVFRRVDGTWRIEDLG
jgi:hypothetical protein